MPQYTETISFDSTSCKQDILYFRDGGGIFLYKPSEGTTQCLYRCVSTNEAFLQQEVLVTSDNIIFALYDKRRWPYYFYPEPSVPTFEEFMAAGRPVVKEFFRINKSGGQISRYATITRRDGNGGLLLLDRGHVADGCPALTAFPQKTKAYSISPSPIPQEIALYRQVEGKCVFESYCGKVLRSRNKILLLWDTKENTYREVFNFYPYTNRYSRLPPDKGGGGFFFPELVTEREMVYVRIPSVPFWVWMLGLGRYPWYLDKLDMETGEVQTLAEFSDRKNAPVAPRLCPCGRHVVYCNWSPKCPEGVYPLVLMDLQTGAKVTIGTGHSVMWLK